MKNKRRVTIVVIVIVVAAYIGNNYILIRRYNNSLDCMKEAYYSLNKNFEFLEKGEIPDFKEFSSTYHYFLEAAKPIEQQMDILENNGYLDEKEYDYDDFRDMIFDIKDIYYEFVPSIYSSDYAFDAIDKGKLQTKLDRITGEITVMSDHIHMKLLF